MTISEAVTSFIAGLGFLGTVALLVLNSRLGVAVANLKSEMTEELTRIEIQVANMRTEAANDRVSFYERLMDNMNRTFVTREAQLVMHQANSARLDQLHDDLKLLNGRVADIG